jgi:hypothetical protein
MQLPVSPSNRSAEVCQLRIIVPVNLLQLSLQLCPILDDLDILDRG